MNYLLFPASLLLFSWLIAHPLSAQQPTGVGAIMKSIPTYRVDADTSLRVELLSKAAFYQLIDQLYVIDQRYRAQDRKTGQTGLMGRMKRNDAANQYLLLKGLKRHGWPTDFNRTKAAFETRSVKAWTIVQHSNENAPELGGQLRPYLKAAYRKGLINRELWEAYVSYQPRRF
ncbi:MAG: hypothetical protein EOO39_06630 [Cytophagaceae bacterium]|nr:MAG: hypothetical protein EOO39_06630 [Cytophagaceae bacterium]